MLLCCGAGGVLSNLTVLIGLGHHADLISIGNIMLLIPGIAFTNSLRDMFSGDTITGLIRCMEALLLALVVVARFYGGESVVLTESGSSLEGCEKQ